MRAAKLFVCISLAVLASTAVVVGQAAAQGGVSGDPCSGNSVIRTTAPGTNAMHRFFTPPAIGDWSSTFQATLARYRLTGWRANRSPDQSNAAMSSRRRSS